MRLFKITKDATAERLNIQAFRARYPENFDKYDMISFGGLVIYIESITKRMFPSDPVLCGKWVVIYSFENQRKFCIRPRYLGEL